MILPTQEHGIALHMFMSSLISFISVLQFSIYRSFVSFNSVQFSHSVVSDSATPWIAACQASLSITNSRSSPRLMSIESVMPSIYLILCRPLLLLPPIPPSIRVFSNESTLCMRWPKYWSFSFSIIIPRYFILFIATVNGSDSLISLSDFSLLVYECKWFLCIDLVSCDFAEFAD